MACWMPRHEGVHASVQSDEVQHVIALPPVGSDAFMEVMTRASCLAFVGGLARWSDGGIAWAPFDDGQAW